MWVWNCLWYQRCGPRQNRDRKWGVRPSVRYLGHFTNPNVGGAPIGCSFLLPQFAPQQIVGCKSEFRQHLEVMLKKVTAWTGKGQIRAQHRAQIAEPRR